MDVYVIFNFFIAISSAATIIFVYVFFPICVFLDCVLYSSLLSSFPYFTFLPLIINPLGGLHR